MAESDEDRAARWIRSSAAMEDLVAANSASNETMLALIQEVRHEADARDKKIALMEKSQKQFRVLMYLMTVGVVVLLGVGVVNAVNLAASQRQQEALRRVAESQNGLIDRVKEYNLVAFYCARTNPASGDPRGDAFLGCMEERYPGGPSLGPR